MMNMKAVLTGLLAITLTAAASAQQGPVPKGVPHLNHVWVVMMENHSYSQLLNNPNAPFTNRYAKAANLATNYFAVAHPSLTNYLETVGGSNFGVLDDNSPDWHNGSCVTNLQSAPNTEASGNAICPITGSGTDAATPAIDTTNESPGNPTINIDGVHSYDANASTVGMSIADQLAAAGKSWKSYQESLPPQGADGVNNSDGYFTSSTDFTQINPQLTPPLTQADLVALYAVKHNPFVYFQSVQEGTGALSLSHAVSFEGDRGLYGDLSSGHVPTYSFIAPNQCNDQHGRGNAGAFCNFDPLSDGSQSGLNPALILKGDQTVQTIVTAIHRSPAWKTGRNAIVVLWDENDYSLAPNVNQVMTIVDTNYGPHHKTSAKYYNHFSLLRTIEGGLGLGCLNHACDSSATVMSDLFGSKGE
jgi:phosphatidylinositol-3-phosphatase